MQACGRLHFLLYNRSSAGFRRKYETSLEYPFAHHLPFHLFQLFQLGLGGVNVALQAIEVRNYDRGKQKDLLKWEV